MDLLTESITDLRTLNISMEGINIADMDYAALSIVLRATGQALFIRGAYAGINNDRQQAEEGGAVTEHA